MNSKAGLPKFCKSLFSVHLGRVAVSKYVMAGMRVSKLTNCKFVNRQGCQV